MACVDKITGNIDRDDCSYRPAQGTLEAYLINLDDLDRTGVVENADGVTITSLALKAGKEIYSVDSIDTGLGLSAVGARDDYGMAFTHRQKLRIIDGTSATWSQLDKMKNASFISLVKTKDGSSENNAYFKLGGLEFGMQMDVDSIDYDAESGTRGVEFVSQEGALEGSSLKIFLDVDVTTTEAWIASNLFTS